ncbi:recombination protein NinG [Massilia sp. TN1-12]|uniref:recombination protein NinG n=1 Tax=Massilia paldalensis TaxID=3377675 RepID=UPI00384FD218
MLRTPLTRRKPIGQRGTILKSTAPRERKCATCAQRFKPARQMQKVCSPACAAVHGRRETERQERAETRERKQAMKTRTDWLRDAQTAFNAYVRERDKDLPCISCGRFHQGAYDAGHYRSVGAQPALRFHEDNVHRQCVPCNQHKSGNAVEYRLGLIARIGVERVEFLEQEHTPAKFTIEQAKIIRDTYRAKLRALKEQA